MKGPESVFFIIAFERGGNQWMQTKTNSRPTSRHPLVSASPLTRARWLHPRRPAALRAQYHAVNCQKGKGRSANGQLGLVVDFGRVRTVPHWHDSLPYQIGADGQAIAAGMIFGIEDQVNRLDSTGTELALETDSESTARPRGPETPLDVIGSPEIDPLVLDLARPAVVGRRALSCRDEEVDVDEVVALLPEDGARARASASARNKTVSRGR